MVPPRRQLTLFPNVVIAWVGLVGLIGGACGCATTPAAVSQSPVRGTVLPESETSTVLKQCSRSTIESFERTWSPSRNDIDALEARLPAFMSRSSTPRPSRPLKEYIRQYVGVISGGHRLVYVNLFHESFMRVGPDVQWMTAPVVVCDGGDSFWGLSFDVDAKTFSAPAFNGEA